MTSSTDVLSNDSLCEDAPPPERTNNRRSTSQGCVSPSDEVQEEIDALIKSLPQVDKYFTIINKIGSGTFSSVYVAKLKDHPEITDLFALKHIIPTSHPSRIESELRCLYEIGGEDNVMGVKACFRERDHVVIVMPYFPHAKFQDYVQVVSVAEVRDYMYALLVSLKRVHLSNIIHRDVKPSNFLCNRTLKKYALVDFGLAQMSPASDEKNKDTKATEYSKGRDGKAKESIAAVKPQRKSIESSEDKKAETTAVNKTRTQSDSQISTSLKRKLSSDDENQPESPRKKRQMSESGVMTSSRSGLQALSSLDTNKPGSTMARLAAATDVHNSHKKPDHKDDLKQVQMTPTAPSLLKPPQVKNVKSPRRLLLTKRTLDKQRCTLFGQPSATKTVSHSANTAMAGTGGGAERTKAIDSGTRGNSVVVMEKDGKRMYKMVAPSSCQCFGRPLICSICMSRSGQQAPRAGTPGFRAPEVLLKCPEQSTAIDIWSAGVIFLSLLSGRYPFFKAPDDMTALAQIISVIGSEEVKAAAEAIGKNLLCNHKTPAIKMRFMCQELRGITLQRQLDGKNAKREAINELITDWTKVPDSAYDLLKRLLDVNPHTRITAADAITHTFFTEEL